MFISIAIITVITLSSFVVLSQSRFGKKPSGKRMERIEASPNYKNGSFQNLSHTPTFSSDDNSFKVVMGMIFRKRVRLRPDTKIPSVKTDLTTLDPGKNILIWMGHSSYFMQLDGKKILVDPVLSGFASPFSFSIKSFEGSNPYSATDIPPVDYLFITHDHWDHLDYNTIKEIAPRVQHVFCGLGVGAHLERWGISAAKITEMDWHDSVSVDKGFAIHATPARHFSGRTLNRNSTLWVSFVLTTPSMNIFLGGDGGYDTHFAQIGRQFGPFDLAILEQGQYDERWRYIHLMPDEVLTAATDLKARRLMPVHNSKFVLGAHPWDEPLEKLIENNRAVQLPLLTPIIGEPVDLDDTARVFRQWWRF
jgi:L-ascorbate metabolism protein UlaG (beta-lactamase superfamily)